MRTTRSIALFAFVALAACQKAETPEQAGARRRAASDSAMTAITAMAANFSRHFSAGHADSLAEIYAADASLMPPNQPAVHGRDSIRAAMAAFFAEAPGASLIVRPQYANATETGAFEVGRWTMTFPAASGVRPDSGKYIATWVRRNGQWKMVNDIWNSDLPPAPAPVARRR